MLAFPAALADDAKLALQQSNALDAMKSHFDDLQRALKIQTVCDSSDTVEKTEKDKEQIVPLDSKKRKRMSSQEQSRAVFLHSPAWEPKVSTETEQRSHSPNTRSRLRFLSFQFMDVGK